MGRIAFAALAVFCAIWLLGFALPGFGPRPPRPLRRQDERRAGGVVHLCWACASPERQKAHRRCLPGLLAEGLKPPSDV